jgi:glycosyltransferase involved in cell wall biosynthesis
MQVKKEIREIVMITDRLPNGESYPSEPNSGCPVTIKDVWGFNDPRSILNIWRAIKETQPDIVMFNIHFMSFGDKKVPAALGLLTPMLCRFTGFPTLVLLHNIVESVDLTSAGFTNSRLLQWLFRMIATVLTGALLSSNMVTVTISKYVEIIRRKYGAKNISLVPHGSFETPPVPDFSRPQGPAKIMTFGKFGTYKRIEVLIDAVKYLRMNGYPDVEVVIAGTDSPNSKGYLAEMQETYQDVPGLTFTGYVPEDDVARVFGESTVVVFPYTSTTGSSGVLHQAGSYGKACVLPKMGDLEMLIEEEGYIGEYFNPGDPLSLARAIETLLIDDVLRIRQAQQNYSASAALPMTDIADWYLSLFNVLLNTKQDRAADAANMQAPSRQPATVVAA